MYVRSSSSSLSHHLPVPHSNSAFRDEIYWSQPGKITQWLTTFHNAPREGHASYIKHTATVTPETSLQTMSWPGTTPCLKKTPPLHYFLYKLSQKWTNFNNFWYTESWKQLTLALTHFFHHTWKMSAHYLVKCKIFHLIKVIYDFLPKLDNFEKSWLLQCPETWTSEN